MPITQQLQPVTGPQWIFGMKTPINGGHELLAWQWSDSSSVNTMGFSGEGGGGGTGSTVVFWADGFGFGGLSVAEWGCQCERVIMFLC